jgi:hypothetical protein
MRRRLKITFSIFAPYNSHLWDQCANIMRTSDRNRLGIRETIEGWRDSIFNLPSSTGFGSFYLALFFGRFGKNGIAEYSNLPP